MDIFLERRLRHVVDPDWMLASALTLLHVDHGGYAANQEVIDIALRASGLEPLDQASRDHILTSMRIEMGEIVQLQDPPHKWAHMVMPHLDIVDLDPCDGLEPAIPPLTPAALNAIGGADLVRIADEYTHVRALLPCAPARVVDRMVRTADDDRAYDDIGPSSSMTDPATERGTCVLRKVATHAGDTAHTIAQFFRCAIADLVELNPTLPELATGRVLAVGIEVHVRDYRWPPPGDGFGV